MDEIPDELMELLDGAHRYSNYIYSKCPFHDDTRASFFVYADTYRCAACGKWGKTEDLLEKLDKTHFYPKQQQSFNYNPFTRWTKNHTLFEMLKTANSNLPIKYLKDRGISKEIQQNLKLGYLDDWITFPIMNIDNKVIGAVARAGEGSNSKSKYILPAKQNPDLLYVPSWDRVMKKDKIYLTFGILDAITLYAAGFASISTTTGKRVTATAFDNIRKVINIIPDLGEMPEALKLAAKLGWRGKVIQLDYPENCKDLNDLAWKAGMSLQEISD